MEPLADPLKDRMVTEVEAPPAKPLSEELLYPKGDGIPDWKVLRTHLAKEGRLKKETILDMVKRVTNLLQSEPNMVKVKDPVTVVGDIHGQYYDFMKLLEVGGDPDSTQYVFLGDYVDRGSFSVEVLLLIYALKLAHPKTVWLLRGNHECRQMTAFFNFRDECEYKYDLTVYYAFMDSFDSLALAALVNGKFLGVHGGLSPELRTVSQLSSISRFMEPPRSGLFCDLLWSDPADEEKEEHQNRTEPYWHNEVRGCSFFFGYDAATTFLDKNGLLSVIRAHEAQLEGYKMHQTNTKTGFPTVITIFSAPNYCDCYNNKGAVLKFENNTLNIQQFNFSPHPYHLPNFMDVFAWSIPFVSEKVTEMLYSILNPVAEDASEEVDDNEPLPPEVQAIIKREFAMDVSPTPSGSPSGTAFSAKSPQSPNGMETDSPNRLGSPSTKDKRLKERAGELRKKVQSVSRLMRVFKTLRQHNEVIVQLKGVTPGHRIPMGLLLQGKDAIQTELDKFRKAKSFDAENEKMPPEGVIQPPHSTVSGAGLVGGATAGARPGGAGGSGNRLGAR